MSRAPAVLLVAALACGVPEGPLPYAPGPEGPPPPAGSLVRDGAEPVVVREGDLDGDGTDEVVMASASEEPAGFGLPVAYVEVFDQRPNGWGRAFDATGAVPPGSPAGARPILQPAAEGEVVGQTVEELELVDFAGDGSPEIVLAVLNVGASAGPLDLWILTLTVEGVRALFLTSTERGGRVEVGTDTVELEFGVYRRRDPGCCPSRIARQTIGWEDGSIRVLATERRRAKG